MRSRACRKRAVDLGDVGDESARLLARLVQLNLVGYLAGRERTVAELFDLADEVPHLVGVAENLYVCRLVPRTKLVGLLGAETNHRRGAEGSIDRLLESVNRHVGRNERDEKHSGRLYDLYSEENLFQFFKRGKRATIK